MSSSYNNLKLDTDEHGIATLAINRPEKLNALNRDVLKELSYAFQSLQASSNIKAVIITGAGDKAFVAGADITELQGLDEESGRKLSLEGQQIFQFIEDSPMPVIAAVNGYALGGGAELALACHLRIASPKAIFGFPETGLALIPGYGGTQRLSKLIGSGRALEMILSGKQIKAERSLDMGLVNDVSDEVLKTAKALATQILEKGPLAVRSAIKAVRHAAHKDGFETEASLFGKLCATEDAKEGCRAFVEKRDPEFKGR